MTRMMSVNWVSKDEEWSVCRDRKKEGCLFQESGVTIVQGVASLGNRKQLDVMKTYNVGVIMAGIDTRRANVSQIASEPSISNSTATAFGLTMSGF